MKIEREAAFALEVDGEIWPVYRENVMALRHEGGGIREGGLFGR